MFKKFISIQFKIHDASGVTFEVLHIESLEMYATKFIQSEACVSKFC